MRAYEILQQYKHTQVDTEHVFLALVQQSGGAVPQILKALNAEAPDMEAKLIQVLEATPPYKAARAVKPLRSAFLTTIVSGVKASSGKAKDIMA